MILPITQEEYNTVEHNDDYYFFTYNEASIMRDITKVEGGGKTSFKGSIFAATTDQECEDKKIELGFDMP